MSSEATKEFSSKQEHSIAYELGWDVVSGSGARPTRPGDIISDEWLGECKTHTSPEHPITFYTDVWTKICQEAIMRHRSPALFVDDGSQDLKKTWVLCYEASIDFRDCLIADMDQFKKMRKNITFKDKNLKEFIQNIKDGFPEDVAEIYSYIVLSAQWADTKIVVMPFNTFKEVYNR